MWFALCLPLPFVIIGGYLLYAGFIGAKQVARYKSWPTTPVVITNGEIKENPYHHESYEALIYYEYRVAETLYQGVSAVTCESGGDAQRVLDQHAGRETVSAAYNPANPQEAILQTTTFVPSFASGVFIFMGAGFLTVGLPILLITIFALLANLAD